MELNNTFKLTNENGDEITYVGLSVVEITLKDVKSEKAMIDQIRIRNGNLPVICGRTATIAAEL